MQTFDNSVALGVPHSVLSQDLGCKRCANAHAVATELGCTMQIHLFIINPGSIWWMVGWRGWWWGFLLTSKMIQVKSQWSSITSLLRLTKFFVWLKNDTAYLLKYLQKHGVLSMSKPCRLLNRKKKLQHHPQARMAVQFFGRWRTSWTRSVPGHRVNFCTVQVRALVTNRQHQSHKDGTRKFQHSKWSVDVNKLAPLEGFRMRDLLWSLSYPILNGLKHPYPPKKSTWKSSGSKPATWNLN